MAASLARSLPPPPSSTAAPSRRLRTAPRTTRGRQVVDSAAVAGSDAETGRIAHTLAHRLGLAPTSGDNLRLPPAGRHSGDQLRGAVERVLAADVTANGVSSNNVAREARMRRVLGALQGATDFIREQSGSRS